MGLLVGLGGVATLLLVLVCVLLCLLMGVLLGVMVSGRRRVRQALAASQADVETLAARLHEIELSRAAAATLPVVHHTDYLITTAGVPTDEPPPLPNRVVLSATLGEPLVKVVAFGYGLRRALSPETRNRIGFEMRREVKRARKQRRRDSKRDTRRGPVEDEPREAAA